jgi:hypothetical protein
MTDVNNILTCYRTEAERNLTFALDRGSFSQAPDPNAYDNIIGELAQAMADWHVACPECGIRFNRFDVDLPTEGQALIVRYAGEQGSLFARSFFPKDLFPKRYLEIAKAYYTAGYDRVGVLRHELGHILGYRHEQIRPEAPLKCFFDPEDKSWEQIDDSPYDPKSVMHYPCSINGALVAGSKDFILTGADKASHKLFYTEECH